MIRLHPPKARCGQMLEHCLDVGRARSGTRLLASLLALVARKRWEALLPDLARNPVFVRHDAFTLPGMFVMGATVDATAVAKSLENARNVLKALVDSPVL